MKHHLNLTEKQALVTRYTGGVRNRKSSLRF